MLQSITFTTLPRLWTSTGIRRLNNVAVLGGGIMGSGIAQACAQSDFKVNLMDMDESSLSKSVSTIRESMYRVARKKFPNDQASGAQFADSWLNNLETSTNLEEAVQGADLVIECIVEKLSTKQSLFREVEKHASSECILVSNTSSLPLRDIGSVLDNRQRFGGLHFFQPAAILRLVEVIRTPHTSESVFQTLVEFTHSLDKVPIMCWDTPGYVVNRLLLPYLLDAIRMAERGVAAPRDIDLGMKLGASHPMGPLELCDFVGLDTLKYICESLTDQLPGDPTFLCPATLHRLVEGGRLGKKTGHGFFKYDPQGKIISTNRH